MAVLDPESIPHEIATRPLPARPAGEGDWRLDHGTIQFRPLPACPAGESDSFVLVSETRSMPSHHRQPSNLVHLPHKVAGVLFAFSSACLAANLLHMPREGAGVVAGLFAEQ